MLFAALSYQKLIGIDYSAIILNQVRFFVYPSTYYVMMLQHLHPVTRIYEFP